MKTACMTIDIDNHYHEKHFLPQLEMGVNVDFLCKVRKGVMKSAPVYPSVEIILRENIIGHGFDP